MLEELLGRQVRNLVERRISKCCCLPYGALGVVIAIDTGLDQPIVQWEDGKIWYANAADIAIVPTIVGIDMCDVTATIIKRRPLSLIKFADDSQYDPRGETSSPKLKQQAAKLLRDKVDD